MGLPGNTHCELGAWGQSPPLDCIDLVSSVPDINYGTHFNCPLSHNPSPTKKTLILVGAEKCLVSGMKSSAGILFPMA